MTHPNVREMMKTTLTSILDAPGWFMKGAPSKLKTYAAKIPCLALQNAFCWFDIPPLSHYLHGIPTNCHYPKYTMSGANPRCLVPTQDNPRCLAPIQDNPTHFWWNTHFWCYPYPCLVRNELQRLAFFHSMKASISATAAGLSLRPKIWVAQRGGNVEWGIGSWKKHPK